MEPRGSRRSARGPPTAALGYDPRMTPDGRPHSGPPSEQGDEQYPRAPSAHMEDQLLLQAGYPPGQPGSDYRLSAAAYRGDQRGLPLAYRTSLKQESAAAAAAAQTSAALYKILCITNINQKVNDDTVKEALVEEFGRFGDISVSICHDSGERLAYIYFRTYKEARAARHAKAKSLLFDRPIDIEPIYEPHESSVESQQSPPPQPPTHHHHHHHQHMMQQATQHLPPLHNNYYGRRHARSPTPPDYYLAAGDRRHMHPYPLGPPPPSHPMHRGRSPPPPPPPGYPTMLHMHQRHLNGHHSPPPPNPHHMMHPMQMPDRYYMHPMHMTGPLSPYSSPPRDMHDQYRGYPPHHPHFMSPNYAPEHMYLPPGTPYGRQQPPPHPSMLRGPDGDKSMNEQHMVRSPPPHDPYYHMEPRGGYPLPSMTPGGGHQPPPPMLPSRSSSSSLYSAGLNNQPHSSTSAATSSNNNNSNNNNSEHQSSSSSSRRPAPDHPVRYMSREFRREKYGSENYSNENDEGRPSRVLFVNNIDSSKSEEDLRIVFNPFGKIDELELRQVSPDTSSALVKYSSMDCAYKAKTATNGKYIGKLKCRITYSRVTASRRLWIGGLGPNTTVTNLEDEFGRYGNVIDMDYTSGRPYAYVEFVTANQAQFATHHLRGTLFAEAERRIRIEYVDPIDRSNKQKPESNTQTNSSSSGSSSTTNSNNNSTNNNPSSRSRFSSQLRASERDTTTTTTRTTPEKQHQITRKRSTSPNDVNPKRFSYDSKPEQISRTVSATAQHEPNSRSNSPVENKSSSSDQELNNNQEMIAEKDRESLSLSSNLSADNSIFITEIDQERIILAKNVKEMINCCSVQWSSQLVLRNFNFPSRIHMCSGRKSTIEKYLNNCIESTSDNCFVLRINQRWRLHPQPKLEEVTRRMQSANSGILIITSRPSQSPILSSPTCKHPSSSSSQVGDSQESIVNSSSNSNNNDQNSKSDESAPTQSRPLKNLISYLEQKNAAGVISLNALESDHSDDSKLLYAFPPGKFALNLLKRVSSNFNYDSGKEEFLLGVIIGGGEAKI